MKNILIAFLTIFILSACTDTDNGSKATEIASNSKSFEEIKSENKETKVTLTTVKGKKINIELIDKALVSKELNGKVVLINFWATWCPPCIKEMPMFNELYAKYKDKFEIVGVLYDKDISPEDLNAFIKKHKIEFPITVGQSNFDLAKAFGDVKRIPESFLYSKDGLFIEKFIGEADEVTLKWYIEQNKDD